MRALDEYLKKLPDPGDDVQIYTEGRRVRIQIESTVWNPVRSDAVRFAESEISKLLHLPAAKNSVKMAERLRDKLEADRWFEHALELEQSARPMRKSSRRTRRRWNSTKERRCLGKSGNSVLQRPTPGPMRKDIT